MRVTRLDMTSPRSRRTVNVEETSSKAMLAIDGAGFDWSYMADDKVPTNMALRPFQDSLRGIEFNKSEFNLSHLLKRVNIVEEQIVFYKKLRLLKSELEKLKQEKESNQLKNEKFDNASKSLDKLIGSQITDNSRKGVGFVSYNVVPPPHIGLFSPPKTNLSTSSLEDFQQSEFEGYGPKTSKSVSEDICNEVREFPDAPLVEELVSNDKLTAITIKGKGWPNSAVVNVVRENQVNAVKASACWVWRPTKLNSALITLKRHNYVDARGNMFYLSDFKEFDGGYVPFGGGAKGGKITGKGTLKTVFFLLTLDVLLSLDFKLADESQVLLKVPRKNNMYSVDIKNIVPKECLTCLVAKATLDESMLWHRRLVHVNFKTINKLVKENLVRGLPLKRFENDQTCVACLKRKQHKASCKSKIQNYITQPLFMLHMDLFSPTFVSSLMNKKYYLVVTDDYSIFTWVFFLATKDETSGILKSFITGIENLVDKKVKIIRCNNGIEFKNKVMSEFCEQKGIKREFSNRVLVVKPHNMTPNELFRGRRPALSFMRPFGCYVTILNTLDYLGKLDGKSDEGFFVGYSLNSKAFRVYNIRTRKVEKSLHIRFLEEKPIIAGDGPTWLFDIDVLTKSMNYVPVVAGTNSNDFVGTEESIGVGHSSKETGSSQDYILMPLWKDGSLFDSSSKNASNNEPQTT
ncbi:putative ribonuclease H-like domain-containing protein [Tanacetum coccineum]